MVRRTNKPRSVRTFLRVLNRVQYPEYVFTLNTEHDRWYIQGRYLDFDVDPIPGTDTGQEELQLTRKWYISNLATDSEIVQTVLKCVLTSHEHRVREHFTYKGERIFGPHFNVEDLVKLCKRSK